jgi:ABC-type transport system substrate-binding protein
LINQSKKKFWRRKMSKKLFVGFSVVVILGMLLAACGPAATTAPAAPAAAATKPAAAPAATGALPKYVGMHGPTGETDPVAEKMNGTGPYSLVAWDHATKTVTLTRNDAYWRKDPLWPGAKVGPAAVKTVLIKGVDEWGTRFATLQAGDADFAFVPRSNTSQVMPLVGERIDYDPGTGLPGPLKVVNAKLPLRLDYGFTALGRDDVFFNQNVKVPEGGSPWIGTGKLDAGRGIPVNFFSDLNIRKAFNYCMDYDTFIKEFMLGEAYRPPYVLTLPGQLGFDPKGAKYEFSLEKCAEAFKASTIKDSTGKLGVWDTGFYMVAVWNVGNLARKTTLDILSANLKKVNPKFNMQVLSMPWAAMLRYYQAGQLPLFNVGWQEDIHDPHNWYSPYLMGTYGITAGFSKEFTAHFSDLVVRGAAESDPAKRSAIYTELNTYLYENAPFILGTIGLGRHYEQKWVSGFINNPLYGLYYYYEMSKAPTAKNPDTLISLEFSEPENLDPSFDYETAGSEVANNVYETLVWYEKASPTKLVPLLAKEYTISPDGLTYTFKLRDGIKFHNGDPLTATDAAYTLQRALLIGSSNNAPTPLLAEPIWGIGIMDLTYFFDKTGGMVGDVETLSKQDPAKLKEICENTLKAIKADDAAGTVTIKLAQPYGPFMVTLAHTVASIMDKKWVIENKGWDGTCN